jgi:hypothetical protein
VVVIQRDAQQAPRAWDGFIERSRAVGDLVTVATQSPSRAFEQTLLINRQGPIPLAYRVGLYFQGIDPSAEDDDDGDALEALFAINEANFATVSGCVRCFRCRGRGPTGGAPAGTAAQPHGSGDAPSATPRSPPRTPAPTVCTGTAGPGRSAPTGPD